jgi:hypothetical protein
MPSPPLPTQVSLPEGHALDLVLVGDHAGEGKGEEGEGLASLAIRGIKHLPAMTVRLELPPTYPVEQPPLVQVRGLGRLHKDRAVVPSAAQASYLTGASARAAVGGLAGWRAGAATAGLHAGPLGEHLQGEGGLPLALGRSVAGPALCELWVGEVSFLSLVLTGWPRGVGVDGVAAERGAGALPVGVDTRASGTCATTAAPSASGV